MKKEELYTLITIGIIINILTILYIVKFPAFYIASVVHSLILNIIAQKRRKFRLHQLGYAIHKPIGAKIINLIINLNMFIPFTNIILFSKMYFDAFKEDEQLIEEKIYKLEPFKKAVKTYNDEPKQIKNIQVVEKEEDLQIEYQNITEKEYQLALKMLNAEECVDFIMMNKDLDKKTKEELLLDLRTKILLNKKIDSKIKKLIK